MSTSVFDLFSVGIGPSSSHTVGPMKAAGHFVRALAEDDLLEQVKAVRVDLFGSLAATGHGHGTLSAIVAGLEGIDPSTVTVDHLEQTLARIRDTHEVRLNSTHGVSFDEEKIILRPLTILKRHTNAVRFTVYSDTGQEQPLATEVYFSIGGGFVVKGENNEEALSTSPGQGVEVPLPFASAAELLAHCEALNVPISTVMMRNETAARSEAAVIDRLLHIHSVMEDCVTRSLHREGTLPGGLNVRRRAGAWHQELSMEDQNHNPLLAGEWVNLIAMAVNEENASGGRVVTAPTNGAAGIIPAVLYYALTYGPGGKVSSDEERKDIIVRFLLVAGAVGALYKRNASISGAEVGCQGEVGSASSMAAGGLAEILGGTPQQVENAAEIAMEHNLGLTCDPIGGLVQVPCIERNAVAANKAIHAARMALRGDGVHHVTLDQVIETMRQTGADMSSKYKETAMGGLAVNVPLC